MTYVPIPDGTEPWGAQVNAAFTDQDTRIVNNANDIAANTLNISNLTSALATTNGNVTTNANNIATNTSNIGTLQGQMTTANSNIGTLQGQMTTAQADILLKVNKAGDTMSGTLNGTAFASTGTSTFANVRVGASAVFGGASGSALAIADVTTPANANPTQGAVMYVESGNIKTRDSAGRIVDGIRNYQNLAGPSPADNGLISWNYDPESQSGGNATTLGTVFIHKLWIPANVTINNIGCVVTTAGSALTYARAAIYSAAGSQLAITTDQSAAWTSTGGKASALSSPLAITTAGYYFVAFLTTGTTAPQMSSTPGTSNAFNFNLTGATLRHATGPTGQASLPASITMSSNVSTGSSLWCCVF